MKNPIQKQPILRTGPRFKGIRLPPEYQDTLRESVEQDQRDPEDQGQPEIQNRIKGSFNG